MKITVHCGNDQIGGCVTEYESNGRKLFVDYGEQLPGVPMPDKLFEIEGLTCGDLSKSALLITHYHGDHIGRIAELPPELPIFMGKISKEIALERLGYMSSVNEQQHSMAERLESVKIFAPGEQFSFGEFRIMPVVIDHSAFDAYAFRIDVERLKVFHTGDFLTHGFRSGKLPQVIENYVGEVDYVVCEATNVNRLETAIMSESELQNPPYGILDFDDDINYGSEEMVEMLPALNLGAHLFGHIHAQHGVKTINGTVFSNGAVMNCDYTNLHIPNLIEIQNAETQTTSSR